MLEETFFLILLVDLFLFDLNKSEEIRIEEEVIVEIGMGARTGAICSGEVTFGINQLAMFLQKVHLFLLLMISLFYLDS